MKKQCNVCGKFLKNPDATHCSEKCLFKSVEKSKSVLDYK
jgi:predicted nucleic acid-binding Zn ribbon protein